MHPIAAPHPPRSSLPPGYRFQPTDEELVMYYLRYKVCGKPFWFQSMPETDVYKSEPWELADYSQLSTREQEWYFFCPVDKKYGNRAQLNRTTRRGYWKASGNERVVHHRSQPVGLKRTLVFYVGQNPDGKRTEWVMHEYKLFDQELERAQVAQDAFVLCRIFQKTGLGPRTRERLIPFLEEDWEDDGAHFVPTREAEVDASNGDGTRNDINVQMETQTSKFLGKRVRSEDEDGSKYETMTGTSSLLNKRLKQVDPNPMNAKGSNDSATTSQYYPKNTNFSTAPVVFPILESNPLATSPPAFDASTVEIISNLESQIHNVSMEKESLKVEVMQAKVMINVLHGRIDQLTQEMKVLKGDAKVPP